MINHLKSYILTHDEGITLRFHPDYTTERLAWDEITHAGIIQTPEQKTVRFIYAEPIDRLATIPEEYESLESLDEELKNRTPWYELTQKEGENIAKTILPPDLLRRHHRPGCREQSPNKSDSLSHVKLFFLNSAVYLLLHT